MAGPAIVLCADDYALTEEVSRGIEELAAAGRLSATSALVTTRHWAEHGRRVAALRNTIAVGLHLNFTLGEPLGAMPAVAPAGRLPALGQLLKAGLTGGIDTREIRAETLRQIERFTAVAGCAPDFIDGHQHVHALNGVRAGVLAALAEAFPRRDILVRDPADRLDRIVARRAAVAKSILLARLAGPFGRQVRALGFPTNDSFSGVSAFDRRQPYALELARFIGSPGRLHLVMCHPGHIDAELSTLDPVVERRQDEWDAIFTYPRLETALWRPARSNAALPIEWPGAR